MKVHLKMTTKGKYVSNIYRTELGAEEILII